jgi:hypothetical protein
MNSESFLLRPVGGLLLASLISVVVTACTADQNLGSHGTQADACTQANACCAAMPTATAAACQNELSLAQAQTDAETACGVLLQGYTAEGLCKSSASPGDGGSQMGVFSDASGAGEGGPATGSNEGVTLTVDSSVQISSIDGENVTLGQIYIAVAVELDNGASAPLPLTFALFTADTTSGIEYTATAETGIYSGGCDPTTSLTGGHSVSCAIIFQTPSDAVTTTLSYELPDGAHVSVPLTTTTCSLCSGLCVDLASDPANCGSCGNVVTQSGGTCQGGALVCPSGEAACGDTCTETQTDPANCGSCGATCGIPGLFPGTCLAGACTVCSEGNTQCASTTSMETCTSNGQWGPATACNGDYICSSGGTGACAPPCATGSALCNGTCIDIESNNDDCGGCGLVCSTGCSGGECVTTLTNVGPAAMAADSANVYFTTDSADDPPNFTVMQLPLAAGGGAAITLASGTASAGSIVVDTTSVYWAEGTNCYGTGTGGASGAIMKVPIGGAAATTLVSTSSCPGGLAVDGTSVYWTTIGTPANEYADGTVMKASLDGATAVTLASLQSLPESLAIDNANVYWPTTPYSSINQGTLMKVSIAGGGTPTALASGQSPSAIAIDTNNIYWINGGGGQAGSIMALPLSGGATPTSLTEVEDPTGLATDGVSIYFSDDEEEGDSTVQPLLKMPLTGPGAGNPTTLVDSLEFYAVSIVLSGGTVYYGGEGVSARILSVTPK